MNLTCKNAMLKSPQSLNRDLEIKFGIFMEKMAWNIIRQCHFSQMSIFFAVSKSVVCLNVNR